MVWICRPVDVTKMLLIATQKILYILNFLTIMRVNFSLPAPVLHIVIKEILYLNIVTKEKTMLSMRPPKVIT